MLKLYNRHYKTQHVVRLVQEDLRGNDKAEMISRLAFFLTSVHCFRARLYFDPYVIGNLLTFSFLQVA